MVKREKLNHVTEFRLYSWWKAIFSCEYHTQNITVPSGTALENAGTELP